MSKAERWLAALLSLACGAAAPLGCGGEGTREGVARRFRALDAPPSGYARVYVFHVGLGASVTERVVVGGRSLGLLTKGSAQDPTYCEYAVTTVPAGAVRVEARLERPEPGNAIPIALPFDARDGGQHFVELRSDLEENTPAAAGTGSAGSAPIRGRHELTLSNGAPPARIAPCLLPGASDARSYDQAVLDEVLACIDAPPVAEPDGFAPALCACWSEVGDRLEGPVALVVSVDAGGLVTKTRAEPPGPLDACLRNTLGAALWLPTPPEGPRELTIRLRPEGAPGAGAPLATSRRAAPGV